MSVNLAARQLGQEDLHEEVQQVLQETGLEPGDLALEITETALLENTETPARTLAALRELGVRVLLDDFGTGYSSLSYLNRFPIDVIKIDRSFIAELAVRPEGSAIVKAIVGMGHALRLQVVAEGIETPEQAREAERLGVDMGQGFLFARPVPAADVERRATGGCAARSRAAAAGQPPPGRRARAGGPAARRRRRGRRSRARGARGRRVSST